MKRLEAPSLSRPPSACGGGVSARPSPGLDHLAEEVIPRRRSQSQAPSPTTRSQDGTVKRCEVTPLGRSSFGKGEAVGVALASAPRPSQRWPFIKSGAGDALSRIAGRDPAISAAGWRHTRGAPPCGKPLPLPVFKDGGGDGGIRTLGTPYRVRRFSKPLPSATRPPLRCEPYASNCSRGSNWKRVFRSNSQ